MLTKKPLTPQEVQFCHEYLETSNATVAAGLAGYGTRGLASRGCRLLKKPEIQEYIEQLQAEIREKYKITSERVMQELALVAFSDFGKFMTVGNDVHSIQKLPEHQRRAVKSISLVRQFHRGGNISIMNLQLKLHDKVEALKLLGNQLGLFKPVQITAQCQTQTISIHSTGMETNPLQLDKANEAILSRPMITRQEQELEKSLDAAKEGDFVPLNIQILPE